MLARTVLAGMLVWLALALAPRANAFQASPPPSFGTYTSECGAPILFPDDTTPEMFAGYFLLPFGSSPFPDLPTPPGSTTCVCWHKVVLETGSPEGGPRWCGDPDDLGECGSERNCGTSCVPVPFVDSDGDRIPWPEDLDEGPYPFTDGPFADDDGDGMPNTYDIMPQGSDPTTPGFVLQNGLISDGTSLRDIVDLVRELGLASGADLPAPDEIPELDFGVEDENGDGVLQLVDGFQGLLETVDELWGNYLAEFGGVSIGPDQAAGVQKEFQAIGKLANAIVAGMARLLPELLDGPLGDWLDALAEGIAAAVSALGQFIAGEVYAIDDRLSSDYTVGFLPDPSGNGGFVVTILDQDGNPIDPEELGADHPFRQLHHWAQSLTGDPVNTANGELVHSSVDLRAAGRGIDLALERVYHSRSVRRGILGHNWSMPLAETYLLIWPEGERLTVVWGDGTASAFAFDDEAGLYLGLYGEFSKIRVNYDEGDPDAAGRAPGFVLRTPTGTEYHFCDPSYRTGLGVASVGWLRKVSDAYGNALVLRRDLEGKLAELIDTLGRSLRFEYDQARDLLLEVRDWAGRIVSYRYDEHDDLIEVSLPETAYVDEAGNALRGRPGEAYTYDRHPAGLEEDLALNHNLTSITPHGSSEPSLVVAYHRESGYAWDKVLYHQVAGELTEYRYVRVGEGTDDGPDPYLPEQVEHRTEVRYPGGERRNFLHGDALLLREEIFVARTGVDWNPVMDAERPSAFERWMTLYEYDDELRLLRRLETNDALHPEGRETRYVYDAANPDRFQARNLLRLVERPYPPAAATPELATEYVYDPVTVSPLRSTDPLGRVWQREFGHHELSYEEAAAAEGIVGWGILPQDPAPELRSLFGLGDRNGDGIAGGSFEPVRFLEPVVRAADTPEAAETAPEVAPETLARYDEHGLLVAWRAPSGTWTELEYAGGYLAGEVQDPGGIERRTRCSMDVHGALAKALLCDGRALRYVRDARGLPLEVRLEPASGAVDADGSAPWPQSGALVQRLSYDLHGRLVSRSARRFEGDPLGHSAVERSIYDAADRRVAWTERRFDDQGTLVTEGTWTREYDHDARVTHETSPAGLVVERTYDPRGALVREARRGPAGEDFGTRLFEYDPFGALVAEVDAEGRRTELGRDGFGRIVSRRAPSGTVTKLTLDAAGRAVLEEAFAGSQRVASVTREHDALDRVVRESRLNLVLSTDGNASLGSPPLLVRRASYGLRAEDETAVEIDPDGESRLVRYQHDALGRRIATLFGPEGEVAERLSLDVEGRVVRRELTLDGRGSSGPTSPSATVWEHLHDGMGRLSKTIDPTGAVTRYRHGPHGLPVRSIDALGRVEERDYASDGLLLAVRALGHGSEPALIERFEHDAEGRLVAMVDAKGQRTEYELDAAGRAAARRFADGSAITTAFDRSDRPLVERLPGGIERRYAYDVAGRLEWIRASGASASVERRFAFDALDRAVHVREAVAGRPATSIARTFDAAGRIVREEGALGSGASVGFDLAYTTAGELSSIRYPSGHVVTRTHDGLGRLASIASSAAGWVASFPERYGLSRFRRAELAGGARLELEFDGAGRSLSRVAFAALGSVLCGDALAYDAAGDLVQRERAREGLVERMEYDSFRRLARWQHDVDAGGSAQRTVNWSWDAAANLEELFDSAAPPTLAAELNELNQLTALDPLLPGLEYAPSGEEEARTEAGAARTWRWDALGRPLTGTWISAGGPVAVEWTYDGFDRLVRRFDPVRGTLRYGHAGSLLLQTHSGAGDLAEIVGGYDLTEPFWRLREGVDALYVHVDAFGNVAALHDGNAPTEAYAYDPFGLVRDAANGAPLRSSAVGNELFFLARPTDLACRVAHLGPRLYDPLLGRFLARDPLGEAGGANLYAYAAANPFRWRDPSGLAPEDNATPELEELDQARSEDGWLGGRGGVLLDADTPIAVLEKALDDWIAGLREIDPSFPVDAQFGELSPEQMESALTLFVETQSPFAGETIPDSVQNTLDWARQGVGHLASLQRLDFALDLLDLPETLVSEGLQLTGLDEATADTTATVLGFIYGGAKSIGTHGLRHLASTSARGGTRLLNPQIRITPRGLAHTLERHSATSSAKFAGKSKFHDGEDIEALIQIGTQQPMLRRSNGYFARTFDVGREIGFDRNAAAPSSIMTIITRSDGELVTAFPGH